MKLMMTALACCAVLAAGAPTAFAAPAPVVSRGAVADQAAAERLQVAAAALGEINAIVLDIFGEGLGEVRSMPDLAAKIDVRMPRIHAGLDQLAALDASLAALEPLGPNGGVGEKVADDLIAAAREQVVTSRMALTELPPLRAAAAAGDRRKVEAGMARMQIVGAITLEGSAISARARVGLFPPGQSQGNQARAFAALAEGFSAMMRYRAGEGATEAVAATLRKKAAELKAEVADGRSGLAAELRAGPATPRDRAFIDQIVPLQRETFDILETGAPLLTSAAADVQAGADTTRHINAFNMLQAKLQDNMVRQSVAVARTP